MTTNTIKDLVLHSNSLADMRKGIIAGILMTEIKTLVIDDRLSIQNKEPVLVMYDDSQKIVVYITINLIVNDLVIESKVYGGSAHINIHLTDDDLLSKLNTELGVLENNMSIEEAVYHTYYSPDCYEAE